jgi:hypothetical protein
VIFPGFFCSWLSNYFDPPKVRATLSIGVLPAVLPKGGIEAVSYPLISTTHTNISFSAQVDQTIYTNRGKGLIDFVLAFQPEAATKVIEHTNQVYRDIFVGKLRKDGIYLELTELSESQVRANHDLSPTSTIQLQDGKTCFYKIHAPWPVLARLAEVSRIKVPVRRATFVRHA